MANDSDYLTSYETALAVVATAMKKARLLIDTLVINSFIGGVLFSTGGMLFVHVEGFNPALIESNPGLASLIQGILYPIGLFYVVIMGVDLFNSNILFFSVGVARGAVSMVDLTISWIVSWWFNLVGNIFVCYLMLHFSGISKKADFVSGSIAALDEKMAFTFVETLLKAMAGNFFVCLAIYLQLMAKPLHVKLLMMGLPIFSFVTMGFTHSVADMFMGVMGLINGAKYSVGLVAWKLFLPAAIGNMIGGIFFSLVIPWYLHLYVVERDQRILHLPRFKMRDEQPELNQDSRVVRVREEELDDEEFPDQEEEKREDSELPLSSESSTTAHNYVVRSLSRASTFRSHRRRHLVQSPSNVFPVYGMGAPAQREQSIASGKDDGEIDDNDDDLISTYTALASIRPTANTIGDQLRRTLSRQATKPDLEAQTTSSSKHRSSIESRRSSINFPRQLQRFSFAHGRTRSQSDLAELNKKFSKAGITEKAANAANEAAGTSDFLYGTNSLPIVKVRGSVHMDPNTEDPSEMDPNSTEVSSAVKSYKPEEHDHRD